MGLLTEGHPTTINFAENPTIKLAEKSVTPPSVEGGGENDVTTMLNVDWRTRMPKVLKTAGEMSFTAAYDVAVYPEIVAMVNVNQLITITFPDGSTLAIWGWLDTFEPGEISEGEQPTADCTIIASNLNDAGVETAPAYSAPPP